MTSDIDPKALVLRVADWLSTNADAFEAIPGQRVLAAFDQAEARALAAFLREAVIPWRPIETAPVDGTRFLAAHIKSGVVCVTWFGKTSHIPLYGWCEGDDPEGTDLWEPTHWMPLPPPPARIEDAEEPSHDRR